MAAVFPLDTTKPWTFNGVTYQYDATEDRWFVISTNKTDLVDDSLEELERGLDVTNTIIDAEIENRTNLLDAAASKNNEQDERLNEIDNKLDLIAGNIGVLDFAGLFTYFTLVTAETCAIEFQECVAAANGDMASIQACTQEQARCENNITTEIPDGQFTSDNATYADTEYLRISNTTLGGEEYDWVSLIEPGDYIELVEQNLRDTALFEVLTDARSDSENIRVQFVRQTALGDSGFNEGETYAIRIFKEERGLDLNAADARYVKRPYTVLFSDDPPTLGDAFTGELQNGELWFDTSTLEMFVWNNNAWVATSPPPSQDIAVNAALADIAALKAKPDITSSTTAPVNPKEGDLWFNPSTFKFAFYAAGSWINPDQS